MARIQDYNSYSVSKNKNFSSDHTFFCDLSFLDVELSNRPPELTDVDDLKCEIEYQVSIQRSKEGIQDLSFKISNIEIEIYCDQHPEPPKEFEFDIVPGENIDPSLILCKKGERIIPSNPVSVSIDMKRSMNPKDFYIVVFFGENE
jgi:hypothetical protein